MPAQYCDSTHIRSDGQRVRCAGHSHPGPWLIHSDNESTAWKDEESDEQRIRADERKRVAHELDEAGYVEANWFVLGLVK